MTLPKLNIDIPQDGYSLREPEGMVLRAKTSAGSSRQRLDQPSAPLEADVQLFLSPDAYQYWRVFWRAAIGFGSLPFLLDLVIENAGVEECEVKIVPGSYSTGIRGDAHVVTLSLEIKRPPAGDPELDDSILFLWGTYGEFGPSVLERLAQLVNVDFPQSLS